MDKNCFIIYNKCRVSISSLLYFPHPPVGSEWIISVEDYVDNSFAAFGSGDPREVRLEL